MIKYNYSPDVPFGGGGDQSESNEVNPDLAVTYSGALIATRYTQVPSIACRKTRGFGINMPEPLGVGSSC